VVVLLLGAGGVRGGGVTCNHE